MFIRLSDIRDRWLSDLRKKCTEEPPSRDIHLEVPYTDGEPHYLIVVHYNCSRIVGGKGKDLSLKVAGNGVVASQRALYVFAQDCFQSDPNERKPELVCRADISWEAITAIEFV